jgi:hypothetical protein
VVDEPSVKSVTFEPLVHENPVHRFLYVKDRLDRAGIPVVGSISVEGVESGTLSITAPDILTGEVTYTWVADPA